MIRAAAILVLLTTAADARVYRGVRYFPVFVQTPAGLGVSPCWGREIELDGNLWCKVPTR